MTEYLRKAIYADLEKKHLFKGLSREEIEEVVRHDECNVWSLNASQTLLPRRHDGKWLYIIVQGYTAVKCSISYIPQEHFFLTWRKPGDLIGEVSIFYHQPSHAVKVIATDDCHLLEIPIDFLLSNSNPEVYRNVCTILAKKLHEERLRSQVLEISDVRQKIARMTINLMEERKAKHGVVRDVNRDVEGIVIPGTLKAEHLAGYIGRPIKTVRDKLNELRESKIIHYTNKDKLIVLDNPALRNLSIQKPKRSGSKREFDWGEKDTLT